MARAMDRDPDNPGMPLWLSQARRAAEQVDPSGVDEFGRRRSWLSSVSQQLGAHAGLPISRAREFARLYKFVADNYPAALNLEQFNANFAAVTQLAQIHGLSKERADVLAPDVFSGKLKAVHLRPLVDELLGQAGQSANTRRMLAKRRGSDFVRHVIDQVKENPDALGIGPIEEVFTPPYNARFVPELAVRQGERWIAVEINIGGETASPYDIGRYLARLAQLEQKYDQAILVLPKGCEDIAEMARRFQREWIDRDVHVVLMPEPGPQGTL